MAGKETFKGPSPRLKRKRFDHSEKARKRRNLPRKSTKASIRRELLKNFEAALKHLRTYNKAPSKDARLLHLDRAMTYLNLCLDVRPGNHLLRAQLAVCRDELRALEKEDFDSHNHVIEIILDPDWQA